MGLAFERWLTKPGTLHFLRRLVASDTLPSRSHNLVKRKIHRYVRIDNADPTARKNHGTKGEIELSSNEVFARRHKGFTEASAVGLQISLNSGVTILGRNPDPSQAFSELTYQSDVKSTAKLGELLLDQPEHRENFKLWVEVLQFRRRLDGFDGVSDVWQGMRMRDVDLPVEGPEADALWTTFIRASIIARESPKRTKLLCEVFDHAKQLKIRDGVQYNGLYKCIIGRFFRLRLDAVALWHDRLTLAGLVGPKDFASVAVDIHRAHAPTTAFRTWIQLQRANDGMHLYDNALREISRLRDKKVARRWHKWLVQHGFMPSAEMLATPDVRELFDMNKNRPLLMARSKESGNNEHMTHTKALKAVLPPLTRESMNTIVGDVHGIQPKEISDSFCARLFATRAFSLDLVIKGLSFLSIERLGPLTLRELTVRAASPSEFIIKIAELNKLGISPGESVFAQLVMKAAEDADSRLWNTLLESDQHPDVYEDAATQEALLVSFLQQQKLAQAHVALAALSLTHSDAHRRGWNRVLQHYVVNRNHLSTLTTIRKMQNQNLPLTLQSLALLRTSLLSERRPGKRPVQHRKIQGIDTLSLLRRACSHTAEHGHFVPVNMWIELLKRYGMTNRWKSTESLVLWLFDHYCPPKTSEEQASLIYRYLGKYLVQQRALKLRLIFMPVMLQALFTWGFRSAENLNPPVANNEQDACESWARGLTLLRGLHQRNLFDVLPEARTAFQQRMWVLFNPGYSKVGMNNHARLVNRISLVHYINHANDIWNGFIDWVDPELLQERQRSDPQLMVQFFGSMYRTNLKTSEYADVEQWAKALGKTEQSHYAQPLSVRGREEAWKNSPFRVRDPVRLAKLKGLGDPNNSINEASELSATVGTLDISSHPPPEHQSPSARSSSSRRQPSQRYIPALP